MSFPKYPAYKDSGVVWIGKVPVGWNIKPIKRVAQLHTEKSNNSIFPVALENIQSKTGKFISSDTEFEGEGVSFQKGDILFGKLRPYLAKVWLADKVGEAVGDFHVISPISCNGDFLRWILISDEVISQIDGSTFGAKMPRASWDFISQFSVPLPSVSEQQAIARFLDRECGKIDALIAEQERLIALLAEKRQAVISHAVTKGLNPNAPMKDSGIPWIGMVPEGWEVVRLSLVSDHISSGTTPDTNNENFYDGDICWVTTGELREAAIKNTTKKVTKLALEKFSALQIYPPGTLLLAMYGATVGRIAWLETHATTNQACCALVFSKKIKMKFVFYTMLAAKESLLLLSSGGGQPNINQEKVRSFRIPVPSLSEQSKIIDFLDSNMKDLDSLSGKIEKTLLLFKERRSALISAAVTGKIDVRAQSKAIAA